MNARHAEAEFLSFLKKSGEDLARLTPMAGANAMMGFYREIRADGCRFDQDEDMLLFQWGSDRRNRPTVLFYDLTRQFILGDGDDDDVWQLSLTFEVDTGSEVLLPSGDRWCQSPEHIEAFERFVRIHPASEMAGSRMDVRAKLRYGCAG